MHLYPSPPGLKPNAAVIVATVRALKLHGGGPPVKPGQPLDGAYTDENTDLVAAGCSNLVRHIQNTKSFGIPVVVAINSFPTDTADELEIVRRAAIEAGAEDAVVCTHHSEVGTPAAPTTYLPFLTHSPQYLPESNQGKCDGGCSHHALDFLRRRCPSSIQTYGFI